MNKTLLLTLCLSFIVQPIVAKSENMIDLQCNFVQECIIAEACETTAFQTDVAMQEDARSALIAVVSGTMTTDAETIELRGFYQDSQLSVSGGGIFPASHHLTVWADASATYTNHISSDFSITYLGTCQ